MATNPFGDLGDDKNDENTPPPKQRRSGGIARTNRNLVWLVGAGVLLLLVIAGILGRREWIIWEAKREKERNQQIDREARAKIRNEPDEEFMKEFERERESQKKRDEAQKKREQEIEAAALKKEFDLLPRAEQQEVVALRAALRKRPLEELPEIPDDDSLARRRRSRLFRYVPADDVATYSIFLAKKYGLIEHADNLKINIETTLFSIVISRLGYDPSSERKKTIAKALAISRKVKAAKGSFAALTDAEKDFVKEQFDLFP